MESGWKFSLRAEQQSRNPRTNVQTYKRTNVYPTFMVTFSQS